MQKCGEYAALTCADACAGTRVEARVGACCGTVRRVTEHIVVLPDREVAERIAADLRDEGFTEVRVEREALAGEDDAEAVEWAVYVREDNVLDDPGAATESGLRERFETLALEHDGWYDKPDG